MTTDPQTPVSPSNRRALVHNAITDALSQAGDWVPLSVRIAATRAALAQVDAWHADEPAPAGLGVSATPSHTDLRQRIARVLTTTSRAEWPYTPGQEKWDHHKHGGQPGHTYSISCALCTGDVDRLADVLAALLPPPADRAAVLHDTAIVYAEILGNAPDHSADPRYWQAIRDVIVGLRRMADEAQQQEPDDTDASEADIDGMLAVGVPVRVVTRPPDTHGAEAPEPEPSVHGESVAHLAGLHDDEHAVDARQPDGAHVCKPGASRYYCPTSGQTESDCHGGFNICCDRPDLHEPAVDARQDGEA